MWRESYLLPTWAWKITCWRFEWMFQSSSGRTGSLHQQLLVVQYSGLLTVNRVVVLLRILHYSRLLRHPPSQACCCSHLTHPSHIGYHHQWSLFLLLSLVWAAHVGCFLFRWGRIVADKFHRVISYFRYLEYWMFINFTLRALWYKMVHITFKW